MAKVTAPLLSFGARGQIGNSIVFGAWRGVQYARQKVIPANPQTNAQQEVRGVFRVMSQLWTLAPLDWKDAWNAFAQGRPFTGRNAFMGRNVEALQGQPDMDMFVFAPGARGGLPPDAISVTGGAALVTVEVTIPDVPPGWELTSAVGIAILDQDPATPYTGPVGIDVETVDPTELSITGLDAPGDYRVGVYLVWEKPTGETAYSIALSDTATVTEP